MSNDQPIPIRELQTPGMVRKVSAVIAAANRIILGKEAPIRLALVCLVTGGHLLIEDIPGVGKTTLAQTLARLLGLSFQRIQFTSDLLPADILGVSVYDRDSAVNEPACGPSGCLWAPSPLNHGAFSNRRTA